MKSLINNMTNKTMKLNSLLLKQNIIKKNIVNLKPFKGYNSFSSSTISDKVVVTAALNGVLTDPAKFDIPVTPEEMAIAASEAYDAGASVVHIHFRDQRPGKGHLPSWEPADAKAISDAIREARPDILVNFTTGTIGTGTSPLAGGKLGPTDGPISCLEAGMPEIAALNSGSLNYLKATRKGTWAWEPLMFENPVEKIAHLRSILNEKDSILQAILAQKRQQQAYHASQGHECPVTVNTVDDANEANETTS